VIIQFLKWRKDIGEYKIKDKLRHYYKIYQFGRSAWLEEKEAIVSFGGQKFKVKSFKDLDRISEERFRINQKRFWRRKTSFACIR